MSRNRRTGSPEPISTLPYAPVAPAEGSPWKPFIVGVASGPLYGILLLICGSLPLSGMLRKVVPACMIILLYAGPIALWVYLWPYPFGKPKPGRTAFLAGLGVSFLAAPLWITVLCSLTQ